MKQPIKIKHNPEQSEIHFIHYRFLPQEIKDKIIEKIDAKYQVAYITYERLEVCNQYNVYVEAIKSHILYHWRFNEWK